MLLDRDRLAARMAELDVAGLSIAVTRGGETETIALGSAEAAGSRPVTPTTLFQAASVSKAVTAASTLRLVARGVLDLDADVNDYLRGWRVPSVGSWQPRVTLRQLLSHTAGTTVHGFEGYERTEDVPSIREVLDGVARANSDPVRVDLVPGTQWRYSGGGTTIQQQVLCDVTGTDFESLLRDEVLEPAGMKTATFAQPLPAGRWDDAAHGHEGDGQVPGGWHVYPELAAAGLWCTPTDLLRYGAALQASLRGADGALLPAELMREAVTPVPPTAHMGLAFFLEPGRFGHGGVNAGFISEWAAGLDDDCGVAAMTNAMTGGPLLTEVVAEASAAFGWPVQPAKRAATLEGILAPFLGRYESSGGLVIEVDGGPRGLTAIVAGNGPIQLALMVDPTDGETVSRDIGMDGLISRLIFGGTGDEPARRVTLRLPGQDVTLTRVG